MSDEGHRYRFSSPKGGWPTFGPDGKIIRDEPLNEREPWAFAQDVTLRSLARLGDLEAQAELARRDDASPVSPPETAGHGG